MSKLVIHGTEYDRATLDTLDLLQVARACRELDITPARIEAALTPGSADSPDRWFALAVIVWASRLAAGEKHPTVASAVAGVPLADIDWVADEEEQPEPDPTQPPPDSEAGASNADDPSES